MQQALTHRSASSKHTERLEFLGDSVLGLVAAERLFLSDKNADEGRLTKSKQRLLSKKPLSQAVIDVGLDKYIILGKFRRFRFQRF